MREAPLVQADDGQLRKSRYQFTENSEAHANSLAGMECPLSAFNVLSLSKYRKKTAVPRIMGIIPNSLWVWSDIESKYQSISLLYMLLGLENASPPSIRGMSPINFMTQG